MTLLEMRRAVADNLGKLSSDGLTVVEGIVTSAGIDGYLNRVYREEIFMLLSDKYPEDFIQTTDPIAMYEGPAVVDTASTGTTLITTTAIFKDSHEGLYVYNADLATKAKIVTYIGDSTVTLDTTIGDTWDGDSVYVLSKRFSFQGDATDLKEIMRVGVKYTSTDTYYRTATRMFANTLYEEGNESAYKTAPIWIRTTETIDDVMIPAVDIIPQAETINGKLILYYIQKPPILASGDSPILVNAGVSEAMVNAATAWGFRKLQNMNASLNFERLYKEGLQRIIQTYKPVNHGRSGTIYQSRYYVGLRNRRY
jgi:hypothetical protein